MKTITITIFLLIFNELAISQNITNTLGTSGIFSIKDGATTYLSLSQSSGYLSLNRSLTLSNTSGSTIGVIYKGADRFIHNFGTYNIFLGVNSGNFTMSGSYNSALGHYSLYSNTTGNYNSAFGFYSLFYNLTGSNNSAFGTYSLLYNSTGSNNSAFGRSSLFSNSTGNYNSAFGDSSLYSNITSNENSAFGYNSLRFNTTGYQNSAFGNVALYSNATGNSNSAFGYYSLYSNTTGNYNSALGHNSLRFNTTGDLNSAFGRTSLYSNTTGNSNSAFGNFSGYSITTGSYNTTIGYNAQVPSGSSSNQVRIGDTYVTYAGIQVAWTVTSDRRWKSNILSSNLGLNFISKLNPVSYTRKNDEKEKTEYGLIAQEVEEVIKQEGVENSGMITVTEEGNYELRYNDLLAPMIKAIQELNTENDELSKGLLAEKTANNVLKERLLKLEQMQNMLVSEIEKMKSKDAEVKEVKLGEK